MTLEQMMDRLEGDRALDAAARVNTRENVRLTFDNKVEEVIQEIVDSNFDLYKRITDDEAFGEQVKTLMFDQYLRTHRNAEALIKQGESKTLEFKSTLRWKRMESEEEGDFFVRSGTGTVKLTRESAGTYVETRFGARTAPAPTESFA